MILDGSLADMATIVVGVLSALIKPVKRKLSGKTPVFTREGAIVDTLNGFTVVPFLLMIGSVFSSHVLDELMKSAKITLAIGGFVGLVFVIGELLKSD